ncbi:MAG TPA: carbohydrate kinase [Pyrinomonadaceae bacterium]|nr:carbohydrate kinase [Pyrinomonadaceae bacterium]
MNYQRYTVVGLGEVLWDELPEGRRLGGAPTNFAFMAAQLGNRGVVASRVGADDDGEDARRILSERGLDLSDVQSDEAHPTGTVRVHLDAGGQPQYVITENVAWDYLEWTPQWEELAKHADAVCFGTLAQRAPPARATIRQFLGATRDECVRIFDVNLRGSFYSAEILAESLDSATVAKLNHEELPIVADLLKLGGRGENAWAHRLIQVFDLEMVCVTRGARGSLMITPSDLIEHSGLEVTVADTVGSGDAFTAALAHHHLRSAPLERIAEAANRLGAWVATQTGGTPALDQSLRDEITGGV